MGIMSIQSSQRHLWDYELVRPLVQFARKERHPLLPDVPTGSGSDKAMRRRGLLV
jgi:hypothetical protein